MDNKPNKIIIHHSGDQTPGNQLKRIESWHEFQFGMKSRRGYWGGYHFLIERSGEIIKTRDLDEEGAHCKGRNSESIGVCLAGNFDFEIPTVAQKKALVEVEMNIRGALNLGKADIYYHFEFADTHCPGYYFKGRDAGAFIKEEKISIIKEIILWCLKLLGSIK